MDPGLELLLAELRRALGSLDLALGTIDEAIVWTASDGRIQWCNDAFDRLAGRPRIQVLGARLAELLPLGRDGRPIPPEEHPAGLAAGGRTRSTGYYEHAQGGRLLTLEVSWKRAPIGGDPGSAVFTVRDVTERRDLELQLFQAQKTEAVGRLAGGVAHDLNNLLTTILGLAELSLEALLRSDPVRRDVEGIKTTGLRAAKLTQQLLAYSRRQIAEPKVINLNQLVLGMSAMLRSVLGEDVRLESVPEPSLGPVRIDPSQMEQVILNLAFNARDAMPRGGTLTLQTANAAVDEAFGRLNPGVPPGDYVLLAVRDEGVGMTPEVRKHLFEPFFTTKGPGRGTGLGLATCYGIVKQNSGHLVVESEPGRGTTVRVYLPRAAEQPLAAPREAGPEEMPGGSETLLVVDDEKSVLDLTARLLSKLGYPVLKASGGARALRLVSQDKVRRIRLVLSDVVMPKMGGKALSDRLRALRPDIRVLFMSGYTAETIDRQGILLPGVAFLQKPFTPQELARKVREALDAPPAGSP